MPLDSLITSRRPGYSLDRTFYTDPAVFRTDVERIFLRDWLYAGHASRIPGPGDYFTFEFDDESLIVIRGLDHSVRALHNTCRHRGSRVCLQPEGSARSLVCPYHQWVYAPDGTLLKARLMPEGFDTTAFGLGRAHVRVLGGLVFVCLAEEPPDFDEFERSMAPRLGAHHLEQAKVATIERYEIRANWKLVEENSRECYHCGAGHPQYTRAVGFAAAIGSSEQAARNRATEEARKPELAARGLETETVPFGEGRWYHFRRFFLRDGMRTESMDGQPVALPMGELGDYESGVFAIVTLPNLLLEANPDYVMTLRLAPGGPQRTLAEVCWLVRGDAREGIDYDIGRLTEFWRLTSEQDWKLCEDNQLGVNSRFYQPGPYAPDERGVEQFIEWYLRRMAESF
jgi:Rieske 2Fe-2S family protein